MHVFTPTKFSLLCINLILRNIKIFMCLLYYWPVCFGPPLPPGPPVLTQVAPPLSTGLRLRDRLYEERILINARLKSFRDTLRNGMSSGHHVGLNSGLSQKKLRLFSTNNYFLKLTRDFHESSSLTSNFVTSQLTR